MSSRPDPYAPSASADPDDHVARAAPVNPGAWDTRSWTLVDETDAPPAESGPEPLGGAPGRSDAAQVVWPEAGQTDAPALDADGVPLAEPPTGPLRSVPAPTEAAAPDPLRERRPPMPGPRPEPAGDGEPAPGARPRRRASATPRTAPRPAPPAPETRLPGPAPEPRTPEAEPAPSPEPGRTRGPDGMRGPDGTRDREKASGKARSARASREAAAHPVPGGSADPVRELMHRHRALCERAVDPLEIAAGLEAHGITDRTAARYRHRDVFSLAEELYVRVPRAEPGATDGTPDADGGAPGAGVFRTVGRGLSHLLPGALCVATLAGLQYVPQTPPYARPAVGALGALTVLAAVGLSLRGVPRTRTAGLWACWLLGYVLYGDWLLAQLLSGEGRAERLLPALGCLCVPLAMSFGVAPAAWCAHLFAARARRRLAGSRSLGDFAAGVRPLLLVTVALFAVTLLAVQGAAHVVVEGAVPPHATQAATAALGVLLFVALLLSAHGFPRAASAGLASACLMVAAVLGAVLAARLPGAERIARPVETAVSAWGPTVVPIVACALAALPLLGYALRVLTGASAHQRGAGRPNHPPRQAR